MKAGCRLTLVVFLLGSLAGCRSNELLESELRTREIQYREMLDDMNRLEHHNDALQREIHSLRQKSKTTPEQTAQTLPLSRIVLGRMTGGTSSKHPVGDD